MAGCGIDTRQSQLHMLAWLLPGQPGGLGGSLWGIAGGMRAGIDPEPARQLNGAVRPSSTRSTLA
jgi:hypothetical protein